MYTASKERYTQMEYKRCGDSGLMFPKVSLGLWHNFGDTSVYENMKQMCFVSQHLTTESHSLTLQIITDRNREAPRKTSAVF